MTCFNPICISCRNARCLNCSIWTSKNVSQCWCNKLHAWLECQIWLFLYLHTNQFPILLSIYEIPYKCSPCNFRGTVKLTLLLYFGSCAYLLFSDEGSCYLFNLLWCLLLSIVLSFKLIFDFTQHEFFEQNQVLK